MGFIRERLPDPVSYFEGRGHTLFNRRGKSFRTDCTLHGGSNPNLSVNRDTGAYHCFSCGAKGGNVLDFELALTGADFVTAVKALDAWDDKVAAAPYKPIPFNARDGLELLNAESGLIALEATRISKGIQPTGDDLARILHAAKRIQVIREAVL